MPAGGGQAPSPQGRGAEGRLRPGGVLPMVVFRLGPAVRRWLAVAAACALMVGVLHWGLSSHPAEQQVSSLAAGSAAIGERVVALTVDAGDGSLIAPLARAMAAADLPATLFVSSAYARAHPRPLQALQQAGDEVEVLAGPSPSTLAADARAVANASGQVPLFAEPAGGQRAGQGLLQAAGRAGLAVMDTAVSPASVSDLLAHLAPGEIARLSVAEAASIPALAQGLQAQGYEAVTLQALSAIAAGAAAASLPSTP
jgi:hypothetical protein